MENKTQIKEVQLVNKLKDSFPDMLDFNNCLKELRAFWKVQAKQEFIEIINKLDFRKYFECKRTKGKKVDSIASQSLKEELKKSLGGEE